MPDHQRTLGRILSEMGPDAGAVAETLRASRIRGVRNTVRHLNPVVYYMMSRVWSDLELWKSYAPAIDVVLGDRLRFDLGEDHVVEVELPGPVQAFLAAFNRGEYPELEVPSR